jgi:hypothetical protein
VVSLTESPADDFPTSCYNPSKSSAVLVMSCADGTTACAASLLRTDNRAALYIPGQLRSVFSTASRKTRHIEVRKRSNVSLGSNHYDGRMAVGFPVASLSLRSQFRKMPGAL